METFGVAQKVSYDVGSVLHPSFGRHSYMMSARRISELAPHAFYNQVGDGLGN